MMEIIRIALEATLITSLSILLVIWIISKRRRNQKTLRKCPACDGTGIAQELNHDDENVSMTMYREIDCRECNGKGYIIEEEE